MTTTPALDQPSSTLVSIDLPAIEAYAGRVDRLTAEISLARSFAVTHGEVRRSYSGEIVSWGTSTHDDVLDYVDGVLHLLAVATREIAERLRDSRDAYAHAVGDSGSAVIEIWAADSDSYAAAVPRSMQLAIAGADQRTEDSAGLARGLDRLAAECGRWAMTLADGLAALTPSWTDRAAELCTIYVHRVVGLTNAAGDDLSELVATFGDAEAQLAA